LNHKVKIAEQECIARNWKLEIAKVMAWRAKRMVVLEKNLKRQAFHIDARFKRLLT
jgi:hypothetical protein